jgi:hypothetical protein
LATVLGSLDAVALLLQAGADAESFNSESKTCSTALQQAVAQNFIHIAELLIQWGADVNSMDPSGKTPLFIAVSSDHRTPEMVQLLLRYGADKEINDHLGRTVLALAQGSPQIAALLEEPQIIGGPLPVNKQPFQKRPTLVRSPRVPIHDRDKMIALHGFRATVVDFFVGDQFESRMEKSISVYELLYGTEKIIESPQSGVLKGKRRDFRWYHLPANNVSIALCSAIC